MAMKSKKQVLRLPVKLIFTEEGINFFIRNKKKLNKFRMADDAEQYGIYLDQLSPSTLQRMLRIGYVSKVELSVLEYISKRQEIMDLSKLIVYATLYRQMDTAVFQRVIQSDLIKRWNRLNPGNIIDDRTTMNDAYLRRVLHGNQDVVAQVKREILGPISSEIRRDTGLLAEEKNIQLFLGEKFLENIRPFSWFILSRFRGSSAYQGLVREIRGMLKLYMEKARIAEYLSLMIMELGIHSENAALQAYATRVYQGSFDPKQVLYDSQLRSRLFADMERQEERVYLSFTIGGKSGSIGTQNRLQVTFYNREAEFQQMKEQIDGKKGMDLQERSLLEFYRDDPDSQANAELGLYYLSYLEEACRKVDVRLESLVNQIRSTDLTVITLFLSL
jgi:hypothetical protein